MIGSPSRPVSTFTYLCNGKDVTLCSDQGIQSTHILLLGKIDLHGCSGSDLETLERVSSCSGLHLVLKLHKCDVVTAGNQTDL